MSSGPQKADHRSNFYMTPHMLVHSVAWRHLSDRGRSVLSVLQARHDGFNNGKIGITIHELSAALGNQNHGANSRALAEVIEKGFAECMFDANRHQSLAREYRLTFVATGKGKDVRPATNEYLEWRPAPGSRRKFGGARTATESRLSVTVTATRRKVSVADTATPSTESRAVSTSARVAVTAPHIGNHPRGISRSGNIPSFVIEPDELRSWASAVIEHLGHGGQRKLARDADVPEPILSKFRRGRGLPDRYRVGLQMACGRRLPIVKFRGAAEDLQRGEAR